MSLQNHFNMSYQNKLPESTSVFTGPKYRITVLSDILVRLEYSETNTFEDRLTELVNNRKFPKFEFKHQEDDKYLSIETKYFTLFYRKGLSFIGSKLNPEQNLKISLKGTDKFWYVFHPEARNYLGTSYSLDGTEGDIKLEKGLYSTDGFVSIDDSNSLIFNEDGSLGKRNDKRLDIYVFMYARDFGLCLKDYFTLTGTPPLVPRYSLGVWWNRNIAYSSKDIEKLVFDFNRHKIPLSIILLGNKWHRENPKMTSGFSFDYKLFKNPRRTAEFLHNHGIRLSVKVNPFQGIHRTEDYFSSITSSLNVTLDQNGNLPFNVFNKDLLASYFDYLIHPLMNLGVDFFCLDYDNFNDITSLRALAHYHFNDFKQLDNRRGIILCRNTLKASHRYPIHYTGETIVSWKNLAMLPVFNSTASNIGISWISNDIGGYLDGIEDGELYTRFVQFGCFSPILRLSADEGAYYKREPWRWDITTNSIISQYLRLRHSLIPYLYSEAYRYTKTGLPLVEPLYYRYPEIYDEPEYKTEYYFGSSLFIAPITKKRDNLMDRSILKLYLPEGIWYDFTTGKKFVGGKRYTSFYREEDYPVFAKSGTILPLAVLDQDNINNTNPPSFLELQIFPGMSSSYELYEDDGVSSLYEQGFYILTGIDYTYQKDNISVLIRPIAGKSGIIPDNRKYRIRFRNTKEPSQINIISNGVKIDNYSTFVDDNDFILDLPYVSTVHQLMINCKGKDIDIDAKRLVDDDVDSILSDLPIETKIKNVIANVMFSNTSIKEKRIEIRKLKRLGINKKYINLFIKLLEYMAEV